MGGVIPLETRVARLRLQSEFIYIVIFFGDGCWDGFKSKAMFRFFMFVLM